MNPSDISEPGPGYFSDSTMPDSVESLICPGCGTSMSDLYKDGRMGCAECYVTFSSTVHRALIVLHGAHQHVGKTLLGEFG